MKTIPLTRGMVAIVDDEDYEWLSQHKWYAHQSGPGRFYAARFPGILMHRVILPGAIEVDHINRNRLDNRRCNLRAATSAENHANVGKRRDNVSGFKGVSWTKAVNRWYASIRENRKTFNLGYFEVVEDAARAYDAEARKRFGEFACLNFPETETETKTESQTNT